MAKTPRKPRPAAALAAAPADDLGEVGRLAAVALKAWSEQGDESTTDALGRSWDFTALPGQGLLVQGSTGKALAQQYVGQQALGADELRPHAVTAAVALVSAKLHGMAG